MTHQNTLKQNPFVTLPEKLEEKGDTRNTRNIEWAEAKYIRKLYNAGLSYADIGKKIGRNGAGIGVYLHEGMAPVTVELAAQCIWENEYTTEAPKADKRFVTAIVQGELHHVRTVKDMVAALGGKFSFVEM